MSTDHSLNLQLKPEKRSCWKKRASIVKSVMIFLYNTAFSELQRSECQQNTGPCTQDPLWEVGGGGVVCLLKMWTILLNLVLGEEGLLILYN